MNPLLSGVNPQAIFPDGRFQSPTAVSGKGDSRDENVFSAILLQHGGSGQQKLFSVPQGGAIPNLKGSGPAVTTNAWQLTYTELTTNISQAGQLGSALGDANFRSFGITLEAAAYTPATGVQRAWGATQFEVADILSKCFFQFKVAGKLQIQGPVWAFPASGGAVGSVSTTGTGTTAGLAQNGWVGMPRRLKTPIMVGRTDVLEGTWGVAAGASLAFSTTGADGQPTLAWVNIGANLLSDVR